MEIIRQVEIVHSNPPKKPECIYAQSAKSFHTNQLFLYSEKLGPQKNPLLLIITALLMKLLILFKVRFMLLKKRVKFFLRRVILFYLKLTLNQNII